MKITNRVFFFSQEDAVSNGYRPCGHCMNVLYKQWKQDPAFSALPAPLRGIMARRGAGDAEIEWHLVF